MSDQATKPTVSVILDRPTDNEVRLRFIARGSGAAEKLYREIAAELVSGHGSIQMSGLPFTVKK